VAVAGAVVVGIVTGYVRCCKALLGGCIREY